MALFSDMIICTYRTNYACLGTITPVQNVINARTYSYLYYRATLILVTSMYVGACKKVNCRISMYIFNCEDPYMNEKLFKHDKADQLLTRQIYII